MVQSRASRTTRRRAIAYAMLVALCLVLLGASATAPMVQLRQGLNYALSPIRETLSGVTRSATSVVATIAEIEQLRRHERDLEQRVQQLEAERIALEALRIENERLTALLDIRSSLDYDTIAATVIGRQVSQFERLVVLDRGTDRDVTVGDPVLAGGGALVGSIIEAGSNYSVALLLNDERSVVIGLIESSRATGEVHGRLSSTLAMTNIPSTDTVTLGDRVVTAGLDLGTGVRSPFPRGLLIGTIIDVQSNSSDIVQSAVIQPTVDMDKLEYVLIVTDFEPIVVPEPGSSPSSDPSASSSPEPEP